MTSGGTVVSGALLWRSSWASSRVGAVLVDQVEHVSADRVPTGRVR